MANNPVTDRVRVNRVDQWRSRLAIFVFGLLLFEGFSGLSIWMLPFSIPNQILVILHTLVGILFLVPFLLYQGRHWWLYRTRLWSHFMITGYVAFAAVALNAVSGLILAVQAALGTAISYTWDSVLIVTTLVILAFLAPHVALLVNRDRKGRSEEGQLVLAAEKHWMKGVLAWSVSGFVALAALSWLYQPVVWVNEFPDG